MACETCHRRKVRCDSIDRSPCSHCRRANIPCTFRLSRPRRRYKGHIQLQKSVHSGPHSNPTSLQHDSHNIPDSNRVLSNERLCGEEQEVPPPRDRTPQVSPLLGQQAENEHLTRSALPTFYETKINHTERVVYPYSRLAYIGTTASNLAHLVNTRTTRLDCLHYPYPKYRKNLPWKPSASTAIPRATPIIRPQESSSTYEPPQWEYRTSPDPDLGILPVQEIRVELIDAYFRYIHPGFPVVDESDFRRRLAYSSGMSADGAVSADNSEQCGAPAGDALHEREPPPLLLIQCVLLAGAHVSNHPTIAISRSSIKAALYHRVRALFDMRYENDRLLLCQAALIATWHTDSADDVSSNAWYWSGIACRILLGLGVHRRILSSHMRLQGQRNMRRLWWLVVQTEVLCALAHGRPVGFDLDDCDQILLSKDDLMEQQVDEATGTTTNVCTANIDFCLSNASLCMLIMEILRLHSPGVKRRLGGENSLAMQEAKEDMNARLVSWCMKLSPNMANPGRPSASFWAAQLHLHYYTAVITLNRQLQKETIDHGVDYGLSDRADYRRWNPRKSTDHPMPAFQSTHRCNDHDSSINYYPRTQSDSLCHTSALSILSIVIHILRSEWTRQCWFSTLTSVLAAAIQLCSDIRSSTWKDGNDLSGNAFECSNSQRISSSYLSNTPSLIIQKLDSVDKLQSLASATSDMALYWPAADGLRRLIENISTELKGELGLPSVIPPTVDDLGLDYRETAEHPSVTCNNTTNSNACSTNHPGRLRFSDIQSNRWAERDGQRQLRGSALRESVDDRSNTLSSDQEVWNDRPNEWTTPGRDIRMKGTDSVGWQRADELGSDSLPLSSGATSGIPTANMTDQINPTTNPDSHTTLNSRIGSLEVVDVGDGGVIEHFESFWEPQIDDLLRYMTDPIASPATDGELNII